ncbi:MAG TPA: peptidoglycan DD-metalloendopeptidase family protein [Chitinophagaceae bacterium]|nr:peptidoglycan DD-metalloendopeptidase family protein [Chitinophagaceae bacterium]
MAKDSLHAWLQKNRNLFHPVVQFNPGIDRIIHIDSSDKNEAFANLDFSDTKSLNDYTDNLLIRAGAILGIGGYDEIRPMYSRSELFNKNISDPSPAEEPRRLHIGIDISGKAGTEIFAPCDGTIHSFAFNNRFGDYGATIILKHEPDDIIFHTLFGHLSLADIQNIREGQKIRKGHLFAHFGNGQENGHWPPHLHFQIIRDMENYKGDYPGVCKVSEREKYLSNCPDPDLILNMMRLVG